VICCGEAVECTTYRTESGYSDGRHPDSVAFTDRIADDLCRRDFTVNAMACRVPAIARGSLDVTSPLTVTLGEDAELIDLFGGREDLAVGIVRCVGEGRARFEEDALRILRCVRFCVQLGFSAEASTRAALKQCREGLARVSRERCAAEWLRMLSSPLSLRYGLELVEEAGLWKYLLPGLTKTPSAEGVARACLLPPEPALRLACLIRSAWDEPTDVEGVVASLRRCCRALRLSRGLEEQAAALLAGSFLPCPDSDADARLLMSRLGGACEGALLLGGVCRLDLAACEGALSCGQAAAEAISLCCRDALERCRAIRARGDALTIGDLALRGGDLAAMGFCGREIGSILERLLRAVLREPESNTPDKLRALAFSWRGSKDR
jgi:tRNA nucleotidyltransferase (CCA-adding enzyme)